MPKTPPLRVLYTRPEGIPIAYLDAARYALLRTRRIADAGVLCMRKLEPPVDAETLILALEWERAQMPDKRRKR